MSKRKYPVDRWSATSVAKNRLAAAVRDPWDQQDPWEVQPEAGAGAEAEGGETDDASDEDAPLLDFMKPIPPEVAGRELSDYLLSLKHKAVISAEVCCVIAYYAHAAGAAGAPGRRHMHNGCAPMMGEKRRVECARGVPC